MDKDQNLSNGIALDENTIQEINNSNLIIDFNSAVDEFESQYDTLATNLTNANPLVSTVRALDHASYSDVLAGLEGTTLGKVLSNNINYSDSYYNKDAFTDSQAKRLKLYQWETDVSRKMDVDYNAFQMEINKAEKVHDIISSAIKITDVGYNLFRLTKSYKDFANTYGNVSDKYKLILRADKATEALTTYMQYTDGSGSVVDVAMGEDANEIWKETLNQASSGVQTVANELIPKIVAEFDIGLGMKVTKPDPISLGIALAGVATDAVAAGYISHTSFDINNNRIAKYWIDTYARAAFDTPYMNKLLTGEENKTLTMDEQIKILADKYTATDSSVWSDYLLEIFTLSFGESRDYDIATIKSLISSYAYDLEMSYKTASHVIAGISNDNLNYGLFDFEFQDKTNHNPTVEVENVSTIKDKAITIDVLANDSDVDGDVISLAHGALASNGTAEIINGKIRYTPNSGFTGEDKIFYDVADGYGGYTMGMVTVNVVDRNRAFKEIDGMLKFNINYKVYYSDGIKITKLGINNGFVLTYVDQNTEGHPSVFVQKFDYHGNPEGVQTQLNLCEMSSSHRVAPLGTNGDFIVKYWGINSYNYYSLFEQKFDRNGIQQGSRYESNVYDDVNMQKITIGDNGELVIARETHNESGYPIVVVQKFDKNGVAISEKFELNAIGSINTTEDNPQLASVGVNGEFVVTFMGTDIGDNGFSINGSSVYIQKFDTTGIPTGPVIKLDGPLIGGWDYDPQITSIGTNGEFVVTFTGSNVSSSVYVQKFDSTGYPIGSQIMLDGDTMGSDNQPQITAVGTSGDFVVVYSGFENYGDRSIFVQKFNSNGVPIGEQIKIEPTGVTDGDDRNPQIIAIGTNGEFVVTFTAYDTDDDYSIYVQKFGADGRPIGSYDSPIGKDVIDLGDGYGQLINPSSIDGHTYYYWDLDGDGTSNDEFSRDYEGHDFVDNIFNHDINGVENSAVANVDGKFGTTDIYRYGEINGIKLALPALGTDDSTDTYSFSLSDSGAYLDLAAIWQQFSSSDGANGTPNGWKDASYLSATESIGGHSIVLFHDGSVYNAVSDTQSYCIAVQVL